MRTVTIKVPEFRGTCLKSQTGSERYFVGPTTTQEIGIFERVYDKEGQVSSVLLEVVAPVWDPTKGLWTDAESDADDKVLKMNDSKVVAKKEKNL